MEFRLLGELEVRLSDRALDTGLPRQQVVLAALLVDAGRPVPMETLVKRVWGEAPPGRARNVLYSHLSRIRSMLAYGVPAPRVERRPAGYVLNIDPETVDMHRFRRLIQQARRPGSADAERASAAWEALRLWRGHPLAGIPGDWAAGVRDSCRQQRLDAAIVWAQAEVRLGRPETVIAVLPDLVAEYPLVEPLEVQLMQALHTAGRDAEAMERYAAVRRRLADELGTDPGTELRELHQAILRGELVVPARQSDAPPVPAQLPPDIPDFVGRESELGGLDTLLDDGPSTAPLILAVTGTAGVGKTALAIRWACRARTRFPDGQLYVDLRGYDSVDPMLATDALAGFLRALGVPDQKIPLSVDERAAAYRTALAGRQMLIVLDNASSAEHVRPLMPGTQSCVVIVTSRDSLAGLVARHGARRVNLDVLQANEATALLRSLIGARADAEPAAVAELARLSVYLPLALRLTAELAGARPEAHLAGLADQLIDVQRRLELLDAGGDPHTAVRAVFSWSYQHLPPAAARAFRRIGLHPGRDYDADAVAALTDTDVVATRAMIEVLVRVHLVQRRGEDRYQTHDLLRIYAAERAADDDAEADRQAALNCLFNHYLATAAATMNHLFPEEAHRRPTPPSAAPAIRVVDKATAKRWLDTERANLVALAAFAAHHPPHLHAGRIATTVALYLLAGAHYPDAITLHGHALRAARAAGDRVDEANALFNLATIHSMLGHYNEATDLYLQAVDLQRSTLDRIGAARTVGELGIVHHLTGAHDLALRHYQTALAEYRDLGDPVGECANLVNLGILYWHQGRNEQALQHYRQAQELASRLGSRRAEAAILDNLGLVYERLGRYDEAVHHYERSLIICREDGVRTCEGDVLSNLAQVYRQLGRHAAAIDHYQQALVLAAEIGDRRLEAKVLNGLGETLKARGRFAEAAANHRSAFAIAHEIRHRYEEARAIDGQARVARANGDRDSARRHWQEALSIYTELEVPEADAVQAELAALDDRGEHTPPSRETGEA